MPSFGLFYLAALLIASGKVGAILSKEFSGLMENLYIHDSLFPSADDNKEWKATKAALLKWYQEVKDIHGDFVDVIGLKTDEEEINELVSKVNSVKRSLHGIFSDVQLSKGAVKALKTELVDHLTEYQQHIKDKLEELNEKIVQLRVVTYEPWVYDLGDLRSTKYSSTKTWIDEEFTSALEPLREPSILDVNTIRFQKVKSYTLALIEIRVKTTENLAKAINSAMIAEDNVTSIGGVEIDPTTLVLEVMPPEEFIVKIETLVNYKEGFVDSSTRDYKNLENNVMKQVNLILNNPYYGRTDTFLNAKLKKITLGRDNKADLEIIVNCRNKYYENKRDIFNNLHRGLKRDRLGTSYIGHTMVRDNIKILGEEEITSMLVQQKLIKKEMVRFEEEDKKRFSYFMVITIPFVTAILILVFTFMMCVNFRHCCCNLCAPTMNQQVSYKKSTF